MEKLQGTEAGSEPVRHEFSDDNAVQGFPADFMCGCPKGDLLGPCEHAAAEREPAVTHTIGIEPHKEPDWALAIVERDADGEQVGVLLETYKPTEDHPLGMLADAINDLLTFAQDAEDVAGNSTVRVLPLSGAVLAALGQPLYTAPVIVRVTDLQVPESGPRWQHQAGEEWHDITAVVPCELPSCEVADVFSGNCTVVAFGPHFTHTFARATLMSVRIPAVTA